MHSNSNILKGNIFKILKMANNESVSLTDIVNESQINVELSVTESQIMSEGIHSTPVPVSYTHLDVYKRQV